MKHIIFLFFIGLSIINLHAQSFLPQKGGHSYTMDIPDYMIKTYELNDVATLQYQNTAKEAYVIVIDDAKEHLQALGIKYKDAKEFLEEFIADYKTDATNRGLSEILEFESNGNKHAQIEMTWDDEETSFFMLITVIETKTHFYKVLAWTVKENVTKLKNDFNRISKSLKD